MTRRWPSLAERHRITRRGVQEETVMLWVGLAVLIVLLMILVVGR